MAKVDVNVTPEKFIKDIEMISVIDMSGKSYDFPQSRIADYVIDRRAHDLIVLTIDGTLYHFGNCSYVIELKNQEEIKTP